MVTIRWSAAPFLLLLLSVQPSLSAIIDNGVIGIPKVKCEDHQMTMEFSMEKPFSGRIFVKGMADRAECSSRFQPGKEPTVVYHLRNGECNMHKQRRIGPQKGIEQSMTVIVSFHDTFITKLDRAYRCTCFFMEADKPVTSEFEVSDLATTDLIDTARMPSCTYRVRRGSLNGPAVSFANVGDSVYHVWQCDSDMFGMLVHSCHVDDGAGGQKFMLHDEGGCAVDTKIVDDLTYNEMTNQAFVVSEAFKFADKPNVFFQCSISLCMKSDGACLGLTPPACKADKSQSEQRTKRQALFRRQVRNPSVFNMDIAADKLTVFDLNEEATESSGIAVLDKLSIVEDQSVATRTSYTCLPTATYASIITAMISLLALLFTFIFLQFRRKTVPTPNKGC